MISFFQKFVAPAVLFVALASCTSDATRGNCPGASVIVEASSLTAFQPGTVTDPTFALYTADITSVSNDCSWDKRERSADSTLTINFRATRPPNGTAATYSVPYFVSVIEGGNILAKHAYTATFSFEPGQSVAEFTENVDSTVINVEHGKQIYDYGILVGLQLTQVQLDYNHAMGRY